MLLLSCTGLSRAFDRGPLFDDLAMEVYGGERIGLVGVNGAGKTTLMRILVGQDTPDAGDVKFHAGARVRLLEQHAEFPVGRTLYAEAQSALAELTAAFDEMVRTAELLASATTEAERKPLAAKYDRLNELLRHHDAYALDHKIHAVLDGLNFAASDHHRDLNSFSGGQQRRVLLAKLLLSAPDVMLLDEPSNHLDIHAVEWLENYLVTQPQAMLIISHDRYFLNRVCTKIFELHNRKITVYPGNYKQYVRLRQEKFEHALKEYEAQTEYILKQEEYIRRVHYGQLAKQAQSRQKQLDKIERLEKPTQITAPAMHFGAASRSGDVVFRVEDLTKRFGDHELFRNVSFDLPRGKRLGIMGPNGCGKTTLLKILLGDERPTSGHVERGHLVDPGYLDQHLKLLDDEKSVIRAVWPEPDPELTDQKMRDLLGRFGMSGPIVDAPVKELSGGERSRAALARLVVLGVNVLILDEPTNHLDIWACDALEKSLLEYEGTAIVVSHDRYFLNRVVDLLIVFEPNNKVQVVHGNYDTYELLRANQAEAARDAARKAAKAPPPPPPTVAAPTKRKRKFPYRKAHDLEAEIATAEAQKIQYENDLTTPDIYRDAHRLKETLKAVEDMKTRLTQLYEHWEEALELNG
jgi:ATP-binding cassette subfamily F protein 3